MRRILKLAAVPLFAILFSVSACAGDSPAASYAKSLKGQVFVLRAHQDLFGSPRSSGWDGRLLYETGVSVANGDAALGGNSNWRGSYFVPATTWGVREVSVKGNQIQLKLREVSVSMSSHAPEVKLNFDAAALSIEDFKRALFTIFFDPSENRDAYIQDNDRKLLAKFIDPEPELFLLPEAKRLKILSGIRSISLSSQPKLERVGKSLYIPAAVLGETSVYNDVRVNKNQRIASSIEALLPDFRRASKAAADFPDAITGIKFQWRVYHRNFMDDGKYSQAPNSIEQMEMLVPREALKDFNEGNLSAFELVQKSILRENGTKVSLTSYDPIGSR